MRAFRIYGSKNAQKVSYNLTRVASCKIVALYLGQKFFYWSLHFFHFFFGYAKISTFITTQSCCFELTPAMELKAKICFLPKKEKEAKICFSELSWMLEMSLNGLLAVCLPQSQVTNWIRSNFSLKAYILETCEFLPSLEVLSRTSIHNPICISFYILLLLLKVFNILLSQWIYFFYSGFLKNK